MKLSRGRVKITSVKPIDYSDILQEFSEHKIKFTVIGGFAAIAHGVVRVTMDIDFAIVLEEKQLKKSWKVLKKLEFLPRQPISEETFSDPKQLVRMGYEKGLKAVSFYHKNQPYLVVDLLFEPSFQFAKNEVVQLELFGQICSVVSIEKLIQLKNIAGRPKDLEDIRELKKLKKR